MESAKWLYSGKVVVFGLSGCFRAKVVIIRQKWLLRAKWLYFGENGCIRGKVV